MPRKLTKLRIDEVSSVDKGAGDGVKVMLYKRDSSDTPHHRPLLFNDIIKLDDDEPRDDDDEQRTNTIDDDEKLSGKLRAMVAALITAMPTLKESEAMHFILHTRHGRKMFEHFSKAKEPIVMNRSEELLSIAKVAGGMEAICKNIIDRGSTTITEAEFSAALMEHAKSNRKTDESVVKTFSRMIEEDADIRRAYGICKGYPPNVMSLEVVSTEVGSSEFADDRAEAIKQLNAMAEKQHRTFEQVFQDPANAKLAARTYPRRDPNWHSAATVA
jgi:hypothetical protein